MQQALFEQMMTDLAVAFGQDVNGPRLSVYFDRLQSHPDLVFQLAVERALDTERFFPSVATLHGHCDRVREELDAQARDAADQSGTLRLRAASNLPLCGHCNDLGFLRRESPLSNQPSTLMKCPYCETAFKGRDPSQAQRDLDAFAYALDRDHAARPVFPAPARYVPFESAEPPRDDFVQHDISVPETHAERVKRMIAESAARMEMSNAGKRKPHETH